MLIKCTYEPGTLWMTRAKKKRKLKQNQNIDTLQLCSFIRLFLKGSTYQLHEALCDCVKLLIKVALHVLDNMIHPVFYTKLIVTQAFDVYEEIVQFETAREAADPKYCEAIERACKQRRSHRASHKAFFIAYYHIFRKVVLGLLAKTSTYHKTQHSPYYHYKPGTMKDEGGFTHAEAKALSPREDPSGNVQNEIGKLI